MKTCTQCGLPKDFSEFGKHKMGKNGLRARCRSCRAQYQADNADHIANYMSAYQRRHPEKISKSGAKYRAAFPEREATRHAKYQQEHPEVERAKSHRRRARVLLAPGGHHTADERILLFEKFDWLCAYCGAPAVELDHVVPLVKGGSNAIENCAPACISCNRSKGAKTLEEWKAIDV